jgi:hypothetical protein
VASRFRISIKNFWSTVAKFKEEANVLRAERDRILQALNFVHFNRLLYCLSSLLQQSSIPSNGRLLFQQFAGGARDPYSLPGGSYHFLGYRTCGRRRGWSDRRRRSPSMRGSLVAAGRRLLQGSRPGTTCDVAQLPPQAPRPSLRTSHSECPGRSYRKSPCHAPPRPGWRRGRRRPRQRRRWRRSPGGRHRRICSGPPTSAASGSTPGHPARRDHETAGCRRRATQRGRRRRRPANQVRSRGMGRGKDPLLTGRPCTSTRRPRP